MTYSTDHIERETLLKAPRTRVWQVLGRAEEFGRWFGVDFQGKTFKPGASVKGRVTSPGYEHLTLEAWVDQVEPEHLLSFRWHADAVDPDVDYSNDPTTLVTFELSDVAGGTWLRICESGFDALPPLRRLNAFRMNSQGWDEQMRNIAQYLESAATVP